MAALFGDTIDAPNQQQIRFRDYFGDLFDFFYA